jgi:uncharacterized membrane protein
MSFGEFLALVHVVAAIVWVGAAIGLEITGHRAIKRADDGVMKAFAESFETLGYVFGVASALVLGFGIWATVHSPWANFSDLWVWLSLVINGVLILVGPLFFAPNAKRLVADSRAKGGNHPDVLARAKRVATVAHLDSVAALFVVYLMVAKPGL